MFDNCIFKDIVYKNKLFYNRINLLNCFYFIFVLFSSTYLYFDFQYRFIEAAELSVFLPNEKPFGLTYGEWSADWWKWLLSSPNDSNPSTDKTGKYCTMNQNNFNVWFLAGTSGGYEERKCSIPEGKAILVSPIEVNMYFRRLSRTQN